MTNSNNKINKVSVKKPLGNTKKDPILIGTFTFKKASIFKECAQNLIHRNGRVNGEFYVDSCINAVSYTHLTLPTSDLV